MQQCHFSPSLKTSSGLVLVCDCNAGDFGEENIPLVRSVAAVQEQLGEGVSVAVILGNHDAWFSMFGNSV